MSLTEGKISVVGAGAFGTALAITLEAKGGEVCLWSNSPADVATINDTHENSHYLPGAPLSERIVATLDLEFAVEATSLLVFAVPSHYMRWVMERIGECVSENTVIVTATKGIENKSLALPLDVINETMPEKVFSRACVLAGPSFASELWKKTPTAVTIASASEETAAFVQKQMSTPWFRLYAHNDVIGAEIGGAVKNVIAIAAGVADGLGYGRNTRAAIITRGLSEMTRLGVSMGAKIETFMGLSGVGDLVLTATGDLSRNRSVGLRLGKGESLDIITKSMTAVAEGVTTTLSVKLLAEKHGVDMPIVEEVYKILYEGKGAKEAVSDLMNRRLTTEFE